MRLNNPNNLKIALILAISIFINCINSIAAINTIIASNGRLEINNGIATKNFSVQVPSNGHYYCNFWILPALQNDSTLTAFKVLINGKFIGEIHPKSENWQSASIINNPYVDLVKGNNTISITTGTSEIPEIESVKFSTNLKNAEISSDSYNKYLNEIINNNGIIDEDSYDDGINLIDYKGTLVIAQKSSLNYSF